MWHSSNPGFLYTKVNFTLQPQLANALPAVATPLIPCAVTQFQEEVTFAVVLMKAEDYYSYICVIGLLLKQTYIYFNPIYNSMSYTVQGSGTRREENKGGKGLGPVNFSYR